MKAPEGEVNSEGADQGQEGEAVAWGKGLTQWVRVIFFASSPTIWMLTESSLSGSASGPPVMLTQFEVLTCRPPPSHRQAR